jgi:hypothetical protein
MKKIVLKLIAALALPLFIASCSEKDYGDADSSLVPNIDNYKSLFSINVVSDSNYVTFNLNADGVYPIWTYNNGSTSVVSTINGQTLMMHPAGTYTVTAKVANKYGISSGSVTLTYTLTKDYIDPKLITYLCGGSGSSAKKWIYNYTVAGHIGCGISYTNPINWWSCSANGKAGCGLYDDTLTFKYAGSGLSGVYVYDPGVGGTIYCNSGVTFSPFSTYNPSDGNDFQATVSKQTATWTFKYVGTDLYLTFPAYTMVGYMPNEDTYDTPLYKVTLTDANTLTLVCYNGSIAWQSQFAPASNQ